jgi:integrase/recombinase XerD
MAFSAKIRLADRAKEDKSRMVYLQVIIDRLRAQVPLGFYVRPDQFDSRRQMIKAHRNAESLNTELIMAIAKANDIASRFRIEGKQLTPVDFRNEYLSPTSREDFIAFMEKEIALKQGSITINTSRQHMTVVNKLKAFVKKNRAHWDGRILFKEINIELIQELRNWIVAEYKSAGPTLNKALKILKQYLADARRKGKKLSDPFASIKIKRYKSNRLSLSQDEVDALEKYYDSENCPANHRKLLRYFLFSCYTGLRISDVKRVTWNNVHGNLLVFRPEKTKSKQEDVTVPLTKIDHRFLPPFHAGHKGPIFDTFADPVSNRLIKNIAVECKIKKQVTYHTSRHTFGSLFAEKGNIIALQKIMGHEDIKTTMGYVHTGTKVLVDAKKEVFGD